MSSKALKTKDAGDLPAHLRDYDSQGRGVPTDSKDFLIPMARVLDAKSPEAMKGNPNRIKNAEAGDIYIKNAPISVVKGDVGFLFQPCYREDAVIEWRPRNMGGGGGGGFVARHAGDFIEKSGDATQRPHPEDPAKTVSVRKSTGNVLVETRYVGGYAVFEDDRPPMPLVLPFSSTGHTVAKQWNMLMAQKRLGAKPADIWLVYYRVKTRMRTRQDQSWYLFDVTDAGPEDASSGLPTTLWCPTREDAERGERLYDQLVAGTKKFEDAGVEEDPASSSTGAPI